jgi:hypothetical protein
MVTITKKNISRHKTINKTIKRVKRDFIKDNENTINHLLDDYIYKMKKGKILDIELFSPYIFKSNKNTCLCEHVLKKHINKDCLCKNLITFSKQGLSGAEIHSIMCNINGLQDKNILKVTKLSNYYIKYRLDTKKYHFIEVDKFTQQTLINQYVNEILPLNSISLINSGYCLSDPSLLNKLIGSKIYGYVLSDIADLGDGLLFLKKIIKGNIKFSNYDSKDDNSKYKLFVNFMLQALLSIEHLHQSKYKIFHGDLKLSNFLVKTSNINEIKYFDFKINGKTLRVKNLGFAVLIIDFDTSSITLKSNNDKDYRIVPTVFMNTVFRPWMNNIEEKFANKSNEQGLDMYKNKNFKKKGKELPSIGILSYIYDTLNPLIDFFRGAGVDYFMDIDICTLAILILTDPDLKNYCIKNKSIYTTLFSFLSPKIYSDILQYTIDNESVNKAVSILSSILKNNNEKMDKIFTNQYVKDLELINYKLFGKT